MKSIRPNVRYEMTNRELHEAMYYKQLYKGQTVWEWLRQLIGIRRCA